MPDNGFRRVRDIFSRHPRHEVEDELAFHLEQRVRDYMAQGMDERSARERAHERLGDLTNVRTECTTLLTDERRTNARRRWLDDLRQDVRTGVRAALHAPLFTSMAIATLALGVGANAAVFGVVKAVLLDSLPYRDADRLVRIYSRFADSELDRSSVSPGAFHDMATRTRSFAQLSAFRWGMFDVAYVSDGGARVLDGTLVDAEFFVTLGVQPMQGRAFTRADEDIPVVLLSYNAWQREFGGAPILNRTLRISGEAYEVIGVLPRGFAGPMGDADLWFPLDLKPSLADPVGARGQHWLGIVGRLAPGVTLATAMHEMAALAEQLEREHPDSDNGRAFVAFPMREAMAGDTRTPLVLLMASAALVLLVTCANLAGALLSRMLSRRRELAVRIALGAGRGRLVRQLLTETAVLALAGALLGLLIASASLYALRTLALPALPPYAVLSLDAGAVIVTLVVALATALAFGAAPALAASGAQPQSALRGEGRGVSEGRRTSVLRGSLVAAQIAISLSLLVGAGLLMRSLWLMSTAPLGFDPDSTMSGYVQLSAMRYANPDARGHFLDELTTRLRAVPGVTDVATASQLPATDMTQNVLTIDGVTLPGDGPTFIPYMSVSDDWFRTLRIAVKRGRTFGPQDLPDGTPVIVISETMARRYWPDRDPIGARIRISPQTAEQWGIIVGVVADLRSDPALAEPAPLAYASNRQDVSRTGRVFVLRTDADPATLVRPFERTLAALDAEIPLRDPKTLRTWIDERLASRRLPALLMMSFGALALLLAAVGIYAMFASLAAAREAEFGIRMALGSSRREIATLVLRQGAAWLVAGLVVGAAGVVLVGTLLRGLLFGVPPLDPVALGTAVIVLTVTATIALLGPVRRATHVDPNRILR
jgi:putative ABC transport system permease protein